MFQWLVIIYILASEWNGSSAHSLSLTPGIRITFLFDTQLAVIDFLYTFSWFSLEAIYPLPNDLIHIPSVSNFPEVNI